MKIEVKNVSKKFKNIYAVNNANMVFESGNVYGFIGRNGSGKSVLLKMICAFYEPSEGEILFDGVNVIKNREFPKSTRSLIENPSFLSDLTGYENLKLLADIQKLIGDEEILDTLDKVNLLSEKDKKYSEYSLGMKQKLGLAQVFMENPDIMILDEPFNGVDKESVKKIREYLLELKKKNKIIIIASHLKEDIEELSDYVYEFDCGNVELLKK